MNRPNRSEQQAASSRRPDETLSRRGLWPAAAGGVASLVVPRHVLGGPGYQAPSDTLNIAGVGVGGMGRRYLRGCNSENVVALCDVDHDFAARVFRTYPKAAVYRDFRQLFDKEKEIDAVIVATPDHSHALITLAALAMGKHVYCAKPLTRTLREVRMVREAARRQKVATQMSVQSCGSDRARGTEELIRSGAIGQVTEVHVWCNHPLYPAGLRRPEETPPVPPRLDWDRWVGPAPFRPYHPAYHPWLWRSWWDFGTGTVGDMACHSLHVFYKALKLATPTLVSGSRTTMYEGPLTISLDGKETLPKLIKIPETESYSSVVTWDFPQRGEMPPVRVHWYDGGIRPHRPLELPKNLQMPKAGLLFVGDKGKLLTPPYGGTPLLLPEDRFRDFQPPPKSLRRTTEHYKEWVVACKSGGETSCDFEFGGNMTEIALLGTFAARSGRAFRWDAENLSVPDDPEIDSWVDPPYRAGWSL